jgi:HSP90 family molecular chaperone
MPNIEELKIRPYARLLTMLGEQLIKNERIALIELIKNSYDADADWVRVSLINFNDNFHLNPNSKIVIEDNGHGMNSDVIKKHWLNPATPEKLNRKQRNEKTERGRLIQGEKGIGRFAMFKLGRDIKLITRAKNSNEEYVLTYDFSKYDDDFLGEVEKEKKNKQEKEKEKGLFLDDLTVKMETRVPKKIIEEDITLGTEKELRKPWVFPPNIYSQDQL